MTENTRNQIKVTRAVQIPDQLKLARYKRSPELGPRILFFSGGTALNPLSKKLTDYTHNSIHLVTPFDSGGSSAKIREAFDMLSVGDMRSRLMALADNTVRGNPEIFKLFSYRFPQNSQNGDLRKRLMNMVKGEENLISDIPDPMRKIIRNHLRFFLEAMPDSFDLRGASIGNLILAGGFLNNKRHIDPVVYMFSKLVEAKGTVRTISSDNYHLAARLKNGKVIKGQRNLTGKEVPPIESAIEDLYLVDSIKNGTKVNLAIRDKVRSLIEKAELICFPIGSFYSSVIANILPNGVTAAIANNQCPKVYVPNTGEDPEQFELTINDNIEILLRYLKIGTSENTKNSELLNFAVIDSKNGTYSGKLDKERFEKLGIEIIDAPLVSSRSSPHVDEDLVLEVLLSLT